MVEYKNKDNIVTCLSQKFIYLFGNQQNLRNLFIYLEINKT
jgi:hypothetical protein